MLAFEQCPIERKTSDFRPLDVQNRRHSASAGCRLFCCPILFSRCRLCSFLKLLSYRHTPMCLVFFTLKGRKFPHGNFRTTRVLRSQNTTCRRNKVSQTSQIPSCDALAGGDFSFIWCFYFMMSLSCAAFATRPDSARSAIRFGNTIRPLNRSDRFQTRSTCSAEPMTMQTTTIAA